MKLFISYPIQDEELAARLAEYLQEAGFDTWVYVQNIVNDKPYTSQIFRAIHEAHVHLVIVTANTSTAKGVSGEIQFSQSIDKPLLPIIFGTEADIPFSLLSYRHVKANAAHLETAAAFIAGFLQRHFPETETKASADIPEGELPDVSSAKTDIESSERIFIAYSRKQRRLVNSLSELLAKNNKRHFWDAQIKAGAAWRRTIQRALDGCTHLIVIWTEDAANSDEVEREVSYALKEGKTIIPLLSKDIPKLPYHLDGFQYVVFDDSIEAIEQDILNAIAGTSDDTIWQ